MNVTRNKLCLYDVRKNDVTVPKKLWDSAFLDNKHTNLSILQI